MIYFKSALFLFFCSFFLGCSLNSQPTPKREFLSHDVITEQISGLNLESFLESEKKTEDTCEEHLKKIICYIDTSAMGISESCSTEQVSLNILNQILTAYRELPDLYQKTFCHLNRVQVHSSLFSIGYASLVIDENRRAVGGYFGLNQEAMESNSFDELFSWKEQLNFGLVDTKDPNKAPKVNEIRIESKGSFTNPGLVYVIVHELNHLIDLYNDATYKINFNECQPDPAQKYVSNCLVSEESFHRISWGETTPIFVDVPEDETLEDFEYVKAWGKAHPLLLNFCYYWCGSNTSPKSLAPDLYRSLSESPFVSGYSTSAPMEDFAEVVTLWALNQSGYSIQQTVLDESSKIVFNSQKQLKSDFLNPKLDWIKNYFSNPDLKFKID